MVRPSSSLPLSPSSSLTHPHSLIHIPFPPKKQICLPERYLLLKSRESEARISLGRLLTRPADSPEVERERKEIFTALEAEQINGVPTYVNCFRNNESRNGFRTWTGIMLQGVRPFLSFFLFSGRV